MTVKPDSYAAKRLSDIALEHEVGAKYRRGLCKPRHTTRAPAPGSRTMQHTHAQYQRMRKALGNQESNARVREWWRIGKYHNEPHPALEF